MYSMTLIAGWADMDFNAHMKNTAFLDKAAEGGCRFILRNEICRPDGTPCARVTSEGGWLDLAAGKLVAPPEALLRAMNSLPRTSDFAVLASSVRERGG